MATRVEATQLTVPAGTLAAAPVSVLLYAQRADLEVLEVMVPPGASGLVGWRLDHSNRQIIPAVDGTWIIADGETVRFTLALYSQQPAYRLTAYNTDTYAHTLYARVHLNDQPIPADTHVPTFVIE